MPKIKNYVHYTDPETNEVTKYEPGDDVPAAHAKNMDPAHFEGDDEDEYDTINYGKLNKEELVQLAQDRGLDVEGTKAELTARLEEHDNALK